MAHESFGSAFRRGYRSMPAAIRAIITVSVGMFILQAIGGRSFNQFLVRWLAFDPHWETALTQPWRLVTYMFLHGSGFHLLFNMLWLWWMGRMVEERVGPRTFTVLYFGSGIGGALLNVGLALLVGGGHVIGASGAVFGIMVAFAVIYPRVPIMLFLLPPIEARYVVAGLIAFDLLFLGSGDGIARVVHLGGAGVGYLLIRAHQRGSDLSGMIRPLENLWMRMSGGTPVRKPRNRRMYSIRDVEILEETEVDDLDRILEKISKHGYEALTDEEKQRLFRHSKRN